MKPTMAELSHRISRAQALREVLSDGQWHHGAELAERVGWRFGGALLLVRRGQDGGPPWVVVREQVSEDGRQHRYRYLGTNASPVHGGLSWKARALAAERRVQELERQLSQLPAQRGLFE